MNGSNHPHTYTAHQTTHPSSKPNQNLKQQLSGVEHEVLEIRAPLQEMLGGLQEAREFVVRIFSFQMSIGCLLYTCRPPSYQPTPTPTHKFLTRPHTQAAKREGLHARLAERAALQGRKDTLRRRIRFLHTLADVEHALRLPGAPPPPPPAGRATSTRHMPLLRELLNGPGEGGPAAPAAAGGTGAGLDAPGMTAHCGALERLAHAWLALAADAGAFPATEEEDDVPTAAAVGVRLQRAEKALLGHLAGAFRTVVCPRSLVVAVAGGEGKGQDGAGEGEGDGPLPVGCGGCIWGWGGGGELDWIYREPARWDWYGPQRSDPSHHINHHRR